MLVALYVLTMFVSASLLFIVQPMAAKLLLPNLGGSSGVWTASMLFFQGMLLAGYLYAHLGARKLSPKQQAVLHIPVVLLAAITLPIALPDLAIDASARPTLWLLATLFGAVGLPFFVVSTTAPLLQHWFAHTDHPHAHDPYFLYAASNLGSMIALLGYPFVVEPWVGVQAQSYGWAGVYALFAVGVFACGFVIRGASTSVARKAPTQDAPPLSWKLRLRWIALAAVPSSLMLGLTQYLTADIAAVPLLWVLPLALYLLTFILVFARRPIWLPNIARSLLAPAIAIVFTATAFIEEMWLAVVLHLGLFFLLALFFHGTLARERPHPARLTEYFLLLSIGGVAGGVFNALIAPAVFDQAIDYRLVMFGAIACVMPARWRLENAQSKNRWVMPIFMAGIAALYLSIGALDPDDNMSLIIVSVLISGFVTLAAAHPRWENAAFATILAFGAHAQLTTEGLVTYDRSFFAAYKVYERSYEGAGKFLKFSHGATVHGAQSLDPDKASIPVSYHHPDGPVGQVLDVIPHREVLVVGLGAGAMASYANENAHFDMLEIDPLVEEIAREYFTYLDTCGEHCTVLIGDGRKLIENSDKKWDIIFLDAYNSDSVPTHLLTREALQLYLDRLTDDGVIVFHVSNRYLDIEGIVGALVADAGLVTRTRQHIPTREEQHEKHIDPSKYTAVARTEAHIAPLIASDKWRETRRADVVWTDDFTNVVRVFEW